MDEDIIINPKIMIGFAIIITIIIIYGFGFFMGAQITCEIRGGTLYSNGLCINTTELDMCKYDNGNIRKKMIGEFSNFSWINISEG